MCSGPRSSPRFCSLRCREILAALVRAMCACVYKAPVQRATYHLYHQPLGRGAWWARCDAKSSGFVCTKADSILWLTSLIAGGVFWTLPSSEKTRWSLIASLVIQNMGGRRKTFQLKLLPSPENNMINDCGLCLHVNFQYPPDSWILLGAV